MQAEKLFFMIQLRSFYDIPPPERSLPQKENGIAAKIFTAIPELFHYRWSSISFFMLPACVAYS